MLTRVLREKEKEVKEIQRKLLDQSSISSKVSVIHGVYVVSWYVYISHSNLPTFINPRACTGGLCVCVCVCVSVIIANLKMECIYGYRDRPHLPKLRTHFYILDSTIITSHKKKCIILTHVHWHNVRNSKQGALVLNTVNVWSGKIYLRD